MMRPPRPSSARLIGLLIVFLLSVRGLAAAQVADAPGSPDAVQVAPVTAMAPDATRLVFKNEGSVPTSSLFTGLKGDATRLPSKWTAYSLGIGGLLSFAARPLDDRPAADDSVATASPRLTSFFGGGQMAGSGWVQYGGAIATFAAGKLAGNYETQVVGAELVRAQILTAGMVYGIKSVAQRERPDGGRYSFPSGHAATSFASATVIWNRLGWKAGLPAYAAAAYIAASRVQDKRHFASDVLFGSAIGLAVGEAVSRVGPKRVAITPLLSPGAVGIQVGKAW